MPADPPPPGVTPAGERFAEQLRNEWTPPPVPITPDFGLGVNLGGLLGSDETPIGYALALTYSNKMDYTPNRLNQLVFSEVTGIADRGYVAREATSSVDLGAIANFAVRAGVTSKFGWKNLYTRNAEELLATNTGFEVYNGNVERHIYQTRYVTRELVQTQLTGDHYIPALRDARIEWKGTFSTSSRDEPENRSLLYFKDPQTGMFRQGRGSPGPYWFRFLDDRLYAGQVDAGVPLPVPGLVDALLKVGGLYRARDRGFDASFYRMYPTGDIPEAYLPPELALAPENIGSSFIFERFDADALPYDSDDDIRAAFAMLDLPLPGGLRLVGGNRMEDWRVALFQGSREAPLQDPTRRRSRDYLWSGNLTWSVTDRQNVRLAGYRTVARPDPRELSPDGYTAVTGDCGNRGNPDVERTRIDNYDVRWEFYPDAGEMISISGFYKDFDRPIIEKLITPVSGRCDIIFDNVGRARNYGAEIEVRKSLGFLPDPLSRLSVGANVTLVHSIAEYVPFEGGGVLELPLQGQSDYLANVNLLYADEGGVQASILVNAFGDRIVRYGEAVNSGGVAQQIPHVVEQGRITVDAKLQRRIGRFSVSLSGRNLTDAETIFFQDSDAGRTRTGYHRPGISASLGLGYALR
jgi:outer membrane receptor protein involved in Fe transport